MPVLTQTTDLHNLPGPFTYQLVRDGDLITLAAANNGGPVAVLQITQATARRLAVDLMDLLD